MKAHFYIGENLIESFDFDPENIGILTTKELPKHSEFTNSGSYVESIIWHMIDADSKEMSFHQDAYKTEDILTVKLEDEVTVYIDYLNKDKNFRQDRETFSGKDLQQANKKAKKWALENLEKFHPDMIKQ